MKGHSAEWEAGAGDHHENEMDGDGDGGDDGGDGDVPGEAAVCQGQVSQHPGWKSKAAAEMRKVDGETFAM